MDQKHNPTTPTNTILQPSSTIYAEFKLSSSIWKEYICVTSLKNSKNQPWLDKKVPFWRFKEVVEDPLSLESQMCWNVRSKYLPIEL